MKNKYIIITLIIFIILLFIIQQKKEHAGSTPLPTPPLSNEAIQNISKIYADTNNTATFNNLNVTGTFNLIPSGSIIAFNSATAPKGWAVCDGQKYKLDNTGVAVVDINGVQTPDLRGRFIRSSYALTDSNSYGENIPVKISRQGDIPVNVYNRDDTTNKVGKMTEHKFGDYGGTDWRVQTVNELAKHSHDFWSTASSHDKDTQNDRPIFEQGDPGKTTFGWKVVVSETGGNFGMGIQPPYYVLTYIMKI